MQMGDNLLNLKIMTHVLLTRFGDDRHIEFPTQTNFQTFLKMVRTIEPDRRWQIFESWETA